jgi:hypothetical protein
MHGRYEDITKVDFTLTEPSHMIGGQGRVAVNFGIRRVVTNATVEERLDAWRQQMAEQLTHVPLSELEQECLTEFLRVLTNEASVAGAVLRPTGLSADQQRAGAQHSRPQDPVSPDQRAQELEQLSVALWALGCLRDLVGAGCGPSTATGAARCSPGSHSLAAVPTGD